MIHYHAGVGAGLAIVETGRYQDYQPDAQPDTRQFWYEVESCQYQVREGPNKLMSWGVWDTPADDGLIAHGHDDLLISAALCASHLHCIRSAVQVIPVGQRRPRPTTLAHHRPQHRHPPRRPSRGAQRCGMGVIPSAASAPFSDLSGSKPPPRRAHRNRRQRLVAGPTSTSLSLIPLV